MLEGAPSRTAQGVAALRAAHQILDAPPWILEDPIAVRLLDDATRAWLASASAGLQAARARALRSHVVTRSRFAEDRLAEAVARGVDQYVVLGAGYDTFAYRQPAWACRLAVFEVDLLSTQVHRPGPASRFALLHARRAPGPPAGMRLLDGLAADVG